VFTLQVDECVQVLKTALRGLNYYQTYDRLFLGYVADCYIEINLLYYLYVAEVNEMNNSVFAFLLADFVWLFPRVDCIHFFSWGTVAEVYVNRE